MQTQTEATTHERRHRQRERLRASLPARVSFRETVRRSWTETTRVLDVSPLGARVRLTRPTERGRLLHLTLALPPTLRRFDHLEPQYCVWGLVRFVSQRGMSSTDNAPRPDNGAAGGFEVGVAFVGKQPPESYSEDPTTRYEPLPPEAENALWRTHEASARGERGMTETRLALPVEVIVEAFDEAGAAAARELTVTENLSRHGAAVFTTLDVEAGRIVRVSGTHERVSLYAAVRARRVGEDGRERLHLQFVDREWPQLAEFV